MADEDPFAHLRNSSPRHSARTTATGWLIIRVVVSGDEESLIAFQPIAEEALSIADEYARGTTKHTALSNSGARLYARRVRRSLFRASGITGGLETLAWRRRETISRTP